MSNEDLITHLPESVISHILSILPTKDVVRTSILSRSWEHKWTSIYNMYIIDECVSFIGNPRKSSFLSFVNRILQFTQNSSIINFHLSCIGEYDQNLTTWISAVLKRNVQILEIEAFGCETIVFPKGLYNSTSLTKLKLSLSCTLNVPLKDCFLNLKSLSIGGGETNTEILNVETPNTGQVTLLFPVLEVLELSGCKWLNVTYVEIKAPELIRFRTWATFQVINDCVIKICGAKLSEFDSCGYNLIDHLVLCSPSLHYAAFDHGYVEELTALRVNNILTGVPGLRVLQLSGEISMALVKAKHRQVVPTFNWLKFLDISDGCDHRCWLEILHLVPSLELLKVTALWKDVYEYGMIESVPKCMSHLKKVVIFMEFDVEEALELVAKFFLKNANNLEKMFAFGEFESVIAIKNKLSEFPRSSTYSSIVVNQMTEYRSIVPPEFLKYADPTRPHVSERRGAFSPMGA